MKRSPDESSAIILGALSSEAIYVIGDAAPALGVWTPWSIPSITATKARVSRSCSQRGLFRVGLCEFFSAKFTPLSTSDRPIFRQT